MGIEHLSLAENRNPDKFSIVFNLSQILAQPILTRLQSSPRLAWLVGGGVVLILATGWWLLRPDPRAAFIADLEQLVADVNARDYSAARRWMSPEFESLLSTHGLTPHQALASARRRDIEDGHVYRLLEQPLFLPRDYAEAIFERSGPGGSSSGARAIAVPFIYHEGRWWIAGSFRGGRDWFDPFY